VLIRVFQLALAASEGGIRYAAEAGPMSELMPDFLTEEATIRRVLARLKREAGRPSDQLLYVGVHNLSQFWWCAMYSVLKSRDREWQFFRAVLIDAWRYGSVLSKFKQIPRSAARLLEILSTIRQREVEKRWMAPEGSPDIPWSLLPGLTLRDLIDPLDDDHAADPSSEHAESYPTYRWHFQRGGYILVGVPDGLSEHFVYEFKSAASDSMFRKVARPVGRTQADVYGLMYHRPDKRLQVYVRDGGALETLHEPVDKERVKETLRKFRSVDKTGNAMPPQPWKCRKCEYASICTVRPAA